MVLLGETVRRLFLTRGETVQWGMMQSWHRTLATALSVPALADDGAELEIAFGQVRAAVVYVLELARAHRLAAKGNVSGDDLWLALGHGRVRFTLNRREELVRIRSVREEQDLTWNSQRLALLDADGKKQDLGMIAQKVINELVDHWRAQPANRFSDVPLRDLEDEPTKG